VARLKALGRHLIVEMWDADSKQLDSAETVELALREAVDAIEGT
jgi:S-adenosylmethionine/arginine decarboxylase-like enzyme